ncbi:hypothetical protein Dimus_013755 [Dionaea muscipula]
MSLATILRISENTGICDYVNEIWEETSYYNPLEITRKFSNDETIVKEGRVKSSEMKPFQRLLHIFVMKNILPRVFEAFEVPLDDKEGEEPVKTNFFEETFLGMSQLRREDGIWWIGSGVNRWRDDVEEDENEEEVAQEENEAVEEETTRSTPAEFQWEQVQEEAEIEGEQSEKEVVVDGSSSRDTFYDAEEEETTTDEDVPTAAAVTKEKKRKLKDSGVDPLGSIPDFDLLHLQAEMNRALKANSTFQELY